jgi:hypothetical protein
MEQIHRQLNILILKLKTLQLVTYAYRRIGTYIDLPMIIHNTGQVSYNLDTGRGGLSVTGIRLTDGIVPPTMEMKPIPEMGISPGLAITLIILRHLIISPITQKGLNVLLLMTSRPPEYMLQQVDNNRRVAAFYTH